MAEQGMLLVVSGPSGTGKGTLCQELTKRHQRVRYSVSATTRSPRPGEKDGLNYFFKSKEEFENMIAEDELLEWAKVYDNYYGTPRKVVMEALAKGEDIILEIDVQGALQVKEKFPECVMIFIAPPSLTELKNRIVNRATDSPEVIEKRMKSARGELAYMNQYHYVIVNDVLEVAAAKLEAILAAEMCRPNRVRYVID